jgi:hypothetical protein
MSCCQQHQSASVTATACPACEFEPFVRNHFFTGKMMGARDFVAESAFHAEKLRHHHARLHGWGVVCGLKVKQHSSPNCWTRYVVVEPGSAVDCCGHEILVPREELVDVAGLPQVSRLPVGPTAPLHALQVCVRFKECPTEDVPLLYDDCGCDDTQCAPNRVLESYELDVLVDPPLPVARRRPADLLAVLAVNLDPGLTGLAPIAGDFVYAVDAHDAASAQYLLQVDLRQQRQTRIPLGARAVALAPSFDAQHVFVVTAPGGGGAQPRSVAIFQTSDGAAVDAGTARPVPGTGANSVVMAAASSDPARRLITLDKTTGDLRPWAQDVMTVLAAQPAAGINVGQGLSGLVVEPDGSHAFAVDEAAGRVKIIDFANPASDLAGLPVNARPSALAFFTSGAARMLAVASRADKLVYLAPLGGGAVQTVTLQREPVALAVAGDWLFVYEVEAGTGYVQAIDLEPLTRNALPLVSAARVAGPAGFGLITLGRDAEPALIDTAQLAFADCGDVVWGHLAGCPACDVPNCVVLATLTHYRPGFEMRDPDPATPPATAAADIAANRSRIDNRLGRRVLASTQTLQAWLECLQDNGGSVGPQGPIGPQGPQGPRGFPGADGAPGIGLNPSLPKIIDIGWSHGETRNFLTEVRGLLTMQPQGGALRALTADEVRERVRTRARIPPFTIYFNRRMTGITRETLRVSVDGPLVRFADNAAQPTGLFAPWVYAYYGDVVAIEPAPGVPMRTPHTQEDCPFAVSFVPRVEAFTDPISLTLLMLMFFGSIFIHRDPPFDIGRPTLTVQLKGDFVFDATQAYSQDGVLDGNNVGGRVGRNEPRPGPITGGVNPSGNLTQGGLFESWMSLTLSDDVNLAPVGRVSLATLAAGPGAGAAPLFADAASEAELTAVPGISRAVARRIVAERQRAPFAGVADFRTRLRLSDQQFEQLKDHLIIL